MNTCLVRAFHNLNIAVPFEGPGPFRARTDGNRMLAPFGWALRYAPEVALGEGL
jgi:hypothetical protein